MRRWESDVLDALARAELPEAPAYQRQQPTSGTWRPVAPPPHRIAYDAPQRHLHALSRPRRPHDADGDGCLAMLASVLLVGAALAVALWLVLPIVMTSQLP